MKNRVVIYTDLDGNQTVIADADGIDFITIDERAPENARVAHTKARQAENGIIEALLTPWPATHRGAKASGEKKRGSHLNLVGGTG